MCWSRMALPGTAGLYVVLHSPAGRVSKERANVCQGLLAYPWEGHIVSCFSGQSQSQGQPSDKGGEVECTPFQMGLRGCMAAF